MAETKAAFGREVLGPIFAEFALRLWIYLSNIAAPDETAILFCARGGLRLQFLYDRFLAVTGLESPVLADSLMVSRIVAVRVALTAGAHSAYEQIGYEFARNRVLDAARAVSGLAALETDSPADWRMPYSEERFRALLASPAGAPIQREIERQASLFRIHLRERSRGRKRIILCDTGLFGSTMQLLDDGMPDISWSTVMIARSNYKRLPAPHFGRAIGLSVEADHYHPWQSRTAPFRYWQLIEAILEPNLRSVVQFTETGGSVTSNLEVENWRQRIPPEPDSILSGVVEYIDALPRVAAPRILADAPPAWRAFQRAVAWPNVVDGTVLDIGRRSEDFGRENSTFTARQWRGPIAALRGQSMWREGELARGASFLRLPLLCVIEVAYGLRWFSRYVRRRVTGQ